MKLTGSHTLDAPRDEVWEALLDPDVIAATLPGCDALEEVGENEYVAPIRVGVGPVEGKFEGRFTLSDIQPPDSYHLDIKGKGAAGFMQGAADIRLEEDGSSTILHYEVNANVGGRVASVGQRLIESTGKLVARQGLKRLEKKMKERRESTESA